MALKKDPPIWKRAVSSTFKMSVSILNKVIKKDLKNKNTMFVFWDLWQMTLELNIEFFNKYYKVKSRI